VSNVGVHKRMVHCSAIPSARIRFLPFCPRLPSPAHSLLPRKPFHPWRLPRDLRGQFLRRNRASPGCPSIHGVVAASAPRNQLYCPCDPAFLGCHSIHGASPGISAVNFYGEIAASPRRLPHRTYARAKSGRPDSYTMPSLAQTSLPHSLSELEQASFFPASAILASVVLTPTPRPSIGARPGTSLPRTPRPSIGASRYATVHALRSSLGPPFSTHVHAPATPILVSAPPPPTSPPSLVAQRLHRA
jgi:hypothetical protein